MKRIIPIIIILITFGLKSYSQIDYFGKVETGYLRFLFTTIQVDPGPNWEGYNLDNEQNGIDINLINGVNFKDRFFTGLGIGYLNFEGIDGFSIFTDFEYLPLKTRLTPLIDIKIGYNHIWNQYEKGTGSALVELGAGLNYEMTENIDIYIQSGFLMTQQSLLIPIRIGLKF